MSHVMGSVPDVWASSILCNVDLEEPPYCIYEGRMVTAACLPLN